jgi:hypothetical protein
VFPLEARHAFGVAGHRHRKDFQRDIAAKLGVARAVHFSHPACAERREDFVRTTLLASSK